MTGRVVVVGNAGLDRRLVVPRLPLAARVPPRTAMKVFVAEARGPADPALAEGERDRTAFSFPRAAIGQLADLDPREAAAVEFVFSTGGRDQVRTAYVEVGDVAAALAFLNLTAPR